MLGWVSPWGIWLGTYLCMEAYSASAPKSATGQRVRLPKVTRGLCANGEPQRPKS